MTLHYRPSAMTIAHAYTLLLEAAVLAASFGMLRLNFWTRDRNQRHGRPGYQPPSDFPTGQQDDAKIGPLLLASVGSADFASSDIEPASEKDQAILYCPEHGQHFNDKPQIQGEQNQRAHLKPMNSDPVKIHDPASLGKGAALAQGLTD
jgi:hypothetical protein